MEPPPATSRPRLAPGSEPRLPDKGSLEPPPSRLRWPSPRDGGIAIALLVVAAIVRASFLAQVFHCGLEIRDLRHVDAYLYDYHARRIGQGDLLERDPRATIPGRPEPGHHAFAASVLGADRVERELGASAWIDYPGYPLFVGAFYAVFGPGTRTVLVGQALLDLLACCLVYDIARRAFDRTVALAALALVALSGPGIFYSGFLLRDSLVAVLQVVLVALSVRAAEPERTPAAWLPAGAALGVLAVVKGPNAVLLLPFLAPGLVREGLRGTALRAAALAGGAAIPVLPFAARNVALGVSPLRLSTLEVPALLTYNVPGAATRGLAFDLARASAAASHLKSMSPVDALTAAIGEHESFLDWANLAAHRTANVWIADDAWDNVRYSFLAPCLRSLDAAPVRFKLIAPFMVLGLVLALLEAPRRRLPVLGPVAAVLALGSVGACLTRYRLHADPEHAILAASGIVWLLREARKKRPHAFMVALSLVAVSLLLHDERGAAWTPTPRRVESYVVSTWGERTARCLLGERPPR